MKRVSRELERASGVRKRWEKVSEINGQTFYRYLRFLGIRNTGYVTEYFGYSFCRVLLAVTFLKKKV